MLSRAASMRREPTEPERRMWMLLRDTRLAGYKFRRQAVIGSRIVDFFCPAKGLIVEVDGHSHDRDVDLPKDRSLESVIGFATIRFTNEDVMRNIEGVYTVLVDALQQRPDRWPGRAAPPPDPLL